MAFSFLETYEKHRQYSSQAIYFELFRILSKNWGRCQNIDVYCPILWHQLHNNWLSSCSTTRMTMWKQSQGALSMARTWLAHIRVHFRPNILRKKPCTEALVWKSFGQVHFKFEYRLKFYTVSTRPREPFHIYIYWYSIGRKKDQNWQCCFII